MLQSTTHKCELFDHFSQSRSAQLPFMCFLYTEVYSSLFLKSHPFGKESSAMGMKFPELSAVRVCAVLVTQSFLSANMTLCCRCGVCVQQDIVDTKVLFGNIEDLVDVARRFLKLLEANITGDDGGEAQVATCFTDMKDELSAVYAQYCRSHDDACDLLIKVGTVKFEANFHPPFAQL